MKIAFIDVTTTVSYGGIQVAVWQLARELTDLGHEVAVFGGDGPIRPELDGRAVAIRTFPFTPREKALDLGNRFRRLWERWSFAKHAKQAVIDGDFDWVVLTKPFDFFWPRLMPSGCRTRFAFMSGGTSFFKGDKWLAKRVDAWLACSHFNAWQIGAHFKRFPKVMFNGVNIEHFHPSQRDGALRHRLGVKPDEVLLTFAGRVVGWKGMGIAIRALIQPALAELPVKLLIIGNGGDKNELIKLAEELGLSDRVIFQEPVPHTELPAWYAMSDIGVFPSIADEAFGITIAEAMACGLPVVGSHIGGIPEVIGNEGQSGLLAPAADPEQLAAALATLVSDPALRKRMGQSARRRIETLFTWRQSAERLVAGLK
ncbi:MAG: glycosyltransferase family 4 protein [Pseudogulbenkiania sp.]|nr:glycosyltransferase family 4 protein [Pseudogulbenkiania sp.]